MAEMVPVFYQSLPDIPTRTRKKIEDEIRGSLIHLVIMKQLVQSDFEGEQPRLLIPTNKVQFNFITQQEMELLNSKQSIQVKILDEALRESTILLAKCTIESQHYYCLTTHWSSFVQTNKLKLGEVIQLWSFRRVRLVDPLTQTFTSDLHFAFNKVNYKMILGLTSPKSIPSFRV